MPQNFRYYANTPRDLISAKLITLMSVWLTHRDKIYEVPPGLTLGETLRRIGIALDRVIPSENGQVVDDEIILAEGQVIKLVPVISGGI